MAKINNTTVYPQVLPASDDLLILTDKNDSDKTKTSSVADFQKFFGVSTVDITITADQFRFLHTNPVDVVAVDSNQFSEVISASIQYTYADAPFTLAGAADICLTHGTASSTYVGANFQQGNFNGVNNFVSVARPLSHVYPNPLGGDKLLLWAFTGYPTGALANGFFKLNVQYRVYTF